jgi:hypothetical protein
MNPRFKTILLFFFAFIFTAGLVIYQRMTGPTYPIGGKIVINGETIKYKLLRTSDDPGDQKIKIKITDTSIKGEFTFRRFKSHDSWAVQPMAREGEFLVASVPHQAPAGKVMYFITLNQQQLNPEPTILRYKGAVPAVIIIPHVFFIFLAMFFAVVTLLETIFKRKNVYLFTWLTVIFFLVSGIILGPIMQEYAFGALWTGWPFGHDLTDNKTLVSLIIWIIALFVLRKNRENRIWPIIAFVVMLAVYMIPHSVLGSEIDYTKVQSTESIK